MKTAYNLMAALIFIAANSTLGYAEDKNAQEAIQHLEKAVESGNKGDAKAAGTHADEAEKDIIKENKETPYTEPAKHITGENAKAEHDKAAFEEIEKAKGHAKKGHAKEAAASANKAETHLKEKEQSK